MSTATITLSPAEYLARERDAASKHEYIDGELRPMAGASRLHNLIAGMIVTLLNNALGGRKVEVYPSEMRVRIPDGPYYYPDAVIAPSPPQMEDTQQDTLLNPLLIVEVLSPSTETIDRGEKLDNYRLIPSLTDYLIVSQDRMRVEHYSRVSEVEWRLVSRDSAEDLIALTSLGIELRLSDLYREWVQQ